MAMQADWIWGFGGGLVIGLAAAVYLLVNGLDEIAALTAANARRVLPALDALIRC